DVAVVNGALDGFELKSDRDRLDRLARQSEIYGAVFDRMTLVVGPRHERQAARMIPDWWGLERTEPLTGGGVLSKPRSHIHRRLAESLGTLRGLCCVMEPIGDANRGTEHRIGNGPHPLGAARDPSD